MEAEKDYLFAFYDFPAEHWHHLRTTNCIESLFATMRLRTDKTRATLTSRTIGAMVYMLFQAAAKGWRKIRGVERLAEVSNGVKFIDGEPANVAEEADRWEAVA